MKFINKFKSPNFNKRKFFKIEFIIIHYTAIKDYENAKNYLNKAIEIEPNYSEAVNNLGIVEMDQKNFISALNVGHLVMSLAFYRDIRDMILLNQ